MTDNVEDSIFEIDRNGNLLRTINIAGIKNPTEDNSDAEGITWMYADQYALVMEGGEEMAIVTIDATTTNITRAQTTIYDLSGDPKGIAYKASEDAIYWVSQTAPLRVVKSQINAQGKLITVWNKVVDNLPDSGLADIAFFPRLSPNIFLIGQSSQTIMEVDLTGQTAVIRSSYSFSAWPIPRPGALAFDADGTFRIVGKHQAGVPQDDFNVFAPTAPIENLPPVANAGTNIFATDFDGNGALVSVNGSLSNDPDGAIINYQWLIDDQVVASGFGPRVRLFVHRFSVGVSTVKLIVRDDARVASQTSIQVSVRRFGGSGSPEDHPPTTFVQPNNFLAVSLNYIHPGSLIQHAEFLVTLAQEGFGKISVYDQVGREVRTLQTPTLPAGQYRAPWDLTNNQGEKVASGTYFVVIQTNPDSAVTKERVVVVR